MKNTSTLFFIKVLILFILPCTLLSKSLSEFPKQQCAQQQNQGLQALCQICQASQFQILEIHDLEQLDTDLSKLGQKLGSHLSSADVNIAKDSKNTNKYCVLIEDATSTKKTLDVLDELFDGFDKFSENYPLPFSSYSELSLENFSFFYNQQSQKMELQFLKMNKASPTVLSQITTIKSISYFTDRGENQTFIQGVFSNKNYYRDLDYTVDLQQEKEDGVFNVELELDQDKLKQITSSFAKSTSITNEQTYRRFDEKTPDVFEGKCKDGSFSGADAEFIEEQNNKRIIDIVTLNSITTTFSLPSLDNSNTECVISQVCNFKLGQINASATQTETARGDHFIKVNIPDLDISQYIRENVPKFYVGSLQLLGMMNIKLTQPEIQLNWGSTQAVRFTGLVEIMGLKNINFDFIGVLAFDGSNSLMLGASLPFESISDVIMKFIPINGLDNVLNTFDGGALSIIFNLNDIDFLFIQEMKPKYIENLNYYSLKLEQGLTVVATLKLGSANNAVTNFLKSKLGKDVGLMLRVTLNPDYVFGMIAINNIDFGNNLILKEAGIFFSRNRTDTTPMSFGLRGMVQVPVKGNNLLVYGVLEFDLIGITLEASMDNIWSRPFGIQRLAIGNLQLSGTITYAGVPSGFQIGGEIGIGLDCYDQNTFIGTKHCLRGKAFVGVSVSDPTDTYLYVESSYIDMDTIMRALFGSKTKQDIQVPGIIQDSIKFPKGGLVSYAFKPQALPNTNIEEGFYLKAAMEVFGVTGEVAIEYSWTQMKFSATAYLDPINFGGVISLTSAESNNKGVRMILSASLLPPSFNVDISARATILGLTTAVKVNINPSRLYFYFTGPILGGVFQVQASAQASHQNFRQGSFDVAASIQMNQQMIQVTKQVMDAVSKELNKAGEELKKSEDKLKKAREDVEAHKKKACDNIDKECAKKGSCKSKSSTCKQYGTKMQCTKHTQKCTGGFKSVCARKSKFCKSKWFSWVCKSVCVLTTSVCKGFSTVCSASRAVVDYSNCKIRNYFCTAYHWVVDQSCKLACEAAKAGISTAQASMRLAEGSLWLTRQSVGGLAKAAKAISNMAGTFFNIKNAGFSIALNSKTNQDGITVDVDAMLIGKSYKWKVNFSWKSIAETAKRLIKLVMDKIKEIFKK